LRNNNFLIIQDSTKQMKIEEKLVTLLNKYGFPPHIFFFYMPAPVTIVENEPFAARTIKLCSDVFEDVLEEIINEVDMDMSQYGDKIKKYYFGIHKIMNHDFPKIARGKRIICD
jgi:hypothetical protein